MEALPDGNSLIDILLEQPAGTGSKHPLERVAGHVTKSKGVDFLYNLLERKIVAVKVDPRLVTLYDLPWRRIYTTNYDNAIEFAIDGRRPISSLSFDKPPKSAAPGSIIHINGSFRDVSPANISSGLILTDYSYSTSRIIESEWYNFFLKDLSAARAIFFVGYSLSDLDIQRALVSDKSISRKSLFFISPKADEIEKDTIRNYGDLISGGVDALVSSITHTSTDYKPVRFSKAFVALKEVRIDHEYINSDTKAKKLSDQLVYGKLPEQEILTDENVFAGNLFLVSRKQDNSAKDALKSGPWRDILYFGELASGKTASALNLTSHLLKDGYRAYYATKNSRLTHELREISNNKEKTVVVFENYSSMRDEIREYTSVRPQLHRVILTEKSVIHEFVSGFITNTPHLGPTFEVNLDRIDRSDIGAFEALVNFGGFWGERSGATENSRQRLITDQLDSSLYKLLIEIIKSEKVQSDIKRLLEPLSNDREAMKLFICSFVINVMGFRFSISEWQTVFDAQWVRRIMRTYAEQVRHFLNIQGDTIFPRAGVLSAHILRTFADDDLVRESLVELYERATRDETADPELDELRISLMRYGSIEPIFSANNKAANIFTYYDEIRVFGQTRNNPDYWLQLGIAGTVHDDLVRAEKAFENAYARERAKFKPNLKKIDNYFSRFEMRKAVELNNSNDAFTIFLRATARLKKQIFLDENRHYPFKTGRYYSDIASKHFDNWDLKQKQQFIREAKEIRQKATAWKNSKREVNTDVEILIKETSSLLAKIEKSVE